MARLVVDTNSLLQCISRRSRYHDCGFSLLDGRNILCVTTEILEEYTEQLQRFTSPEFTEAALGVITNNPYTLFVTPYFHFKLITADPDDDKFVDCAVAANAKFVVTDDGHFDVLKQIDFPKVEIIGLDDIIQKL
jgi:predicted nucleic acid-binding protein